MKRHTFGKLLLTILLLATALVSDVVDWNESHLFNPDAKATFSGLRVFQPSSAT